MGRKTNEYRLELVYQFIVDYILEQGYAPSLREIDAEIGVNSTSLVRFYLAELQDRGKLSRQPGIARSIVLVGSPLPESLLKYRVTIEQARDRWKDE